MVSLRASWIPRAPLLIGFFFKWRISNILWLLYSTNVRQLDLQNSSQSVSHCWWKDMLTFEEWGQCELFFCALSLIACITFFPVQLHSWNPVKDVKDYWSHHVTCDWQSNSCIFLWLAKFQFHITTNWFTAKTSYKTVDLNLNFV